NLRLGTNYDPPQPETHFQFPGDHHSFARAALRCVGVGNCRRESGGVMCPSYMVTREEMHSTRGRAHLLWEAMQGSLITGGWRDRNVRQALDLCLSCKGCKSDCPVNVDMATYKAEFLAHYYEGRMRPRSAYAMGEIRRWAELASHAPGLANLVARTPPLSALAKLAAGVSQHRRMPAFAEETFTDWFHARRASPLAGSGERVLLFPDTFNDFFHPQVAQEAVAVLQRAGCEVVLPPEPLCCGRPLYDYGLLEQAKRRLRQTLSVLHEEIAAGTPMLVLEPSCAAVFRDEMVNLFPHDEDARRLSRQTCTLPELLERLQGWEPPRLADGKTAAMVQIHCHQHALLQPEIEARVLARMGVEVEQLDAGCCGMAGSFGFENSHYGISRAVGERRLLPAVRNAPSSTLIVADGFSCREQIQQLTGRRGLHLAQVLELAARNVEPGARPERHFAQRAASRGPYLAAGAALAAGLALWSYKRKGMSALTRAR
ncbi:MAG: (Fe-S)-binding protein, partial [Terriglobales bacterium]